LYAPWLRRSSLLPAPGGFLLAGRAVLGTNPLPPFGRSYVLGPAPYEADWHEVLLAGQREPLTWDALASPAGGKSLDRLRQHLEENGHDHGFVSHHLRVLRDVAGAPPADRERRLREAVESRFHIKDIRAVAEGARSHCNSLRLLGTMQWLFVVLVLPISLSVGIGGRLALLLFGTIAVLHVALVWNALRAHRSLHPEDSLWGPGFLLAISPLHAMRSAEHVGRTALSRFEPLAVVLACGEPEDFIVLARDTHRRLTQAEPSLPPRTSTWNAMMQHGLERLLKTARVHHTHLEMPDRNDGSANSYCPRCRTLYALTEGYCTECIGVPLRKLNTQLLHDTAAVLERMKSKHPPS
ncbi:MAG: hypothetical protein RL760_176, partial [Candidatus Eisenbacteria bacterium]